MPDDIVINIVDKLDEILLILARIEARQIKTTAKVEQIEKIEETAKPVGSFATTEKSDE